MENEQRLTSMVMHFKVLYGDELVDALIKQWKSYLIERKCSACEHEACFNQLHIGDVDDEYSESLCKEHARKYLLSLELEEDLIDHLLDQETCDLIVEPHHPFHFSQLAKGEKN